MASTRKLLLVTCLLLNYLSAGVTLSLSEGNLREVTEGDLTVKYLMYPEDGGDAQIAIDYQDAVNPPSTIFIDMRGESNRYGPLACDASNICLIENFQKSSELYTISATGFVGSLEISSAETTFQDLYVQSKYEAPILNFGLNNTYDSAQYSANLTTEDGTALCSATVDCSNIDQSTTCFGFVTPGTSYDGTSALYLKVQFGDETNTIIVPQGQLSNN